MSKRNLLVVAAAVVIVAGLVAVFVQAGTDTGDDDAKHAAGEGPSPRSTRSTTTTTAAPVTTAPPLTTSDQPVTTAPPETDAAATVPPESGGPAGGGSVPALRFGFDVAPRITPPPPPPPPPDISKPHIYDLWCEATTQQLTMFIGAEDNVRVRTVETAYRWSGTGIDGAAGVRASGGPNNFSATVAIDNPNRLGFRVGFQAFVFDDAGNVSEGRVLCSSDGT